MNSKSSGVSSADEMLLHATAGATEYAVGGSGCPAGSQTLAAGELEQTLIAGETRHR